MTSNWPVVWDQVHEAVTSGQLRRVFSHDQGDPTFPHVLMSPGLNALPAGGLWHGLTVGQPGLVATYSKQLDRDVSRIKLHLLLAYPIIRPSVNEPHPCPASPHCWQMTQLLQDADLAADNHKPPPCGKTCGMGFISCHYLWSPDSLWISWEVPNCGIIYSYPFCILFPVCICIQ